MEISIPSILRIKPDSLYKTGKYLRKENLKNAAIFYGEGIKELFRERILISLLSSEINILYEETVYKNVVETVFDSISQLPKGVDVILAVGGGKAIDYAKYIGFVSQIPVISIPTSISNDGFASPISSLELKGKKTTIKVKIPYGVIIDTNIINSSPEKFVYSGIGDLISKITAIYDWKLSYRKTGEPVNDFAVLISEGSVENLVHYPNKNIRDLEFLRLVSGALVMSGVAMEVSKSSRPASGSEHLLSHGYDKVCEKPSLHGLQVGVATYCISKIQDNKHETVKYVLEESGFFDYLYKNPLDRSRFLEAVDIATTIKEKFYTILSEQGNQERLKEFILNDETCKRVMV